MRMNEIDVYQLSTEVSRHFGIIVLEVSFLVKSDELMMAEECGASISAREKAVPNGSLP